MEEIIKKIEKNKDTKPALLVGGITLVLFLLYWFTKKPAKPNAAPTTSGTGVNITYPNGYILNTDGTLTDKNGNTVQSNVYSYDATTGTITYTNGYLLSSTGVLSSVTGKVISTFVDSYNPLTNSTTYLDNYTLDTYTGVLTDDKGNTIATNVKAITSTGGIVYYDGYTLTKAGELLDENGNLLTSNVTSYAYGNTEYKLANVGNFWISAIVTYSDGSTLSYISDNNGLSSGFITNPSGVVIAVCGAVDYSSTWGTITFGNGNVLSTKTGIMKDSNGKSLGVTGIVGYYQPASNETDTIYSNGYMITSDGTILDKTGTEIQNNVTSYNSSTGNIIYTDGTTLSGLGVLSNSKGLAVAANVTRYCIMQYSYIQYSNGYKLSTVYNTSQGNPACSIVLQANTGLYYCDDAGNATTRNTNSTQKGGIAGLFQGQAPPVLPVSAIPLGGTFSVPTDLDPWYLNMNTGNFYLYSNLSYSINPCGNGNIGVMIADASPEVCGETIGIAGYLFIPPTYYNKYKFQ